MADDKGAKGAMGDQSGEGVTHDEGKVDPDNHGWAPDVDSPEGSRSASDSGAQGDAPQAEGDQEGGDAPPSGTDESTTRRGEDVEDDGGQDPDRHDTGTKGPAERPTGTSSASDYTGVDPQEPIDP